MTEDEQYAMAWAVRMAKEKAKQSQELVAFYEKRRENEDDADWPYARDLAQDNVKYHKDAMHHFHGIAASLLAVKGRVSEMNEGDSSESV